MLEDRFSFKRRYAMQMGLVQAVCEIPAPDRKVSPEDARDLIEWLNMIVRRLERDIESGTPCHVNPEVG